MKILSWNVRGLGNPRTVYRLRNKLREINPQILFLRETKICAKKMEVVRRKCGFVHDIIISVNRSKGGLSLGWKQNDMVILCSFSNHHIDVEIQEDDGDVKWRFTGFYGHPEERLHSSTWNLLKRLGQDQRLP